MALALSPSVAAVNKGATALKSYNLHLFAWNYLFLPSSVTTEIQVVVDMEKILRLFPLFSLKCKLISDKAMKSLHC